MTHHIISLSAVGSGRNSQTSSSIEDPQAASEESSASGKIASQFTWPRPSNDRAVSMAMALQYLASRAASSTP